MKQRLLAILWDTIHRIQKDHIGAYAAQSAFFMLVSIIPFLMLLASLLQYTPIDQAALIELLTNVMPDYIAPYIIEIVNEVFNQSIAIVSISAVTAVWSAAKAIQYLTNGLNAVNDIEESRNYFLLRLYAVFHTIILLAIIVFLMFAVVFGDKLRIFLIGQFTLAASILRFLLKFRYLIVLVAMVLFFALVYKALPNRDAKYLQMIPSALAASLAWMIFSAGLGIYVNYFGGFSMYGSLSVIVLLMFWIYVCMYIFLVCAELSPVLWELIGMVKEHRENVTFL
jgi:membrane protein